MGIDFKSKMAHPYLKNDEVTPPPPRPAVNTVSARTLCLCML